MNSIAAKTEATRVETERKKVDKSKNTGVINYDILPLGFHIHPYEKSFKACATTPHLKKRVIALRARLDMLTGSDKGDRHMTPGKTDESRLFAATFLTGWCLRTDLVIRCHDSKDFQRHLIPRWVEKYSTTMSELKAKLLASSAFSKKEQVMWDDLTAFTESTKKLLHMP
ncbi:unnamed protein product [Amoebophrya sp. A25]|nr:unnamed protein product [Amoebophrya sp. A25]|eukprot:GSA25T00008143001.1